MVQDMIIYSITTLFNILFRKKKKYFVDIQDNKRPMYIFFLFQIKLYST